MTEHAQFMAHELEAAARPMKVPPGHGWRWIVEGFRLFRRAPLTLAAMTLIWLAIAAVLSFIPLLGPIAVAVLAPVLFGGFMLTCDRLQKEQPVTVGQLFSGFSGYGGPLTLVGILYFVGLLILGLTAGALDTLLFPQGGVITAPTLNSAAGLTVALSIPLLMAVWYAPALVTLNRRPPAQAMKLSFSGAASNLPAFLLFLLLSTLFSTLAALPLLLGFLVWGPVVLASAYCGYRDIYANPSHAIST